MHASNKPVSEDEKADDVFSRRHLYCGTPVVTSWAVAGQQVCFTYVSSYMYPPTPNKSTWNKYDSNLFYSTFNINFILFLLI